MVSSSFAGRHMSRVAARGVAAAAVLFAAGCGGDEDAAPEAPVLADTSGVEEPGAESPEGGSWSYEGQTGPAAWGELEPDYATCATGQRQSPVDLIDASEAPSGEAARVTYDHQPASYEVVNTGHTILAGVDSPAGGITVDGEEYELLQFHAHLPSEHAFDGERADLEVHLVHQNAAGELAVVGVLVEGGQSDYALADAWAVLPTGEETVALADFDPGTLLPEDRTTYQYEGSLTTPPCTEGVQWLVMRETATAPFEVINAFEDAVGESARPLQPLNDRDPVLGQPEG